MDILIAWSLFALIVGAIAAARGRSALGYFALSLALSPLIGLILVLLLSNRRAAALPSPKTHLRCPDCRELVLKDARLCKHCGLPARPPAVAFSAHLKKIFTFF